MTPSLSLSTARWTSSPSSSDPSFLAPPSSISVDSSLVRVSLLTWLLFVYGCYMKDSLKRKGKKEFKHNAHIWIIAGLRFKKIKPIISPTLNKIHSKKRISPIIPWVCHHCTDCPSFGIVLVVLYPIMFSRLGLHSCFYNVN